MTRLMVLGLLTNYPMSGYEMQQLLQQSQTDQWAGILPGSIYHALKKLAKEKLIEIETIEHTGNRQKAVYKITEQGRDEFKRLLIDTLLESSVTFPTGLYTAVSFLHTLPTKDVIDAIEQQRNNLEQGLAEMKQGEKLKAAHVPLDDIVLLTFENIYEQYRIQLSFLSKLRELLLGKLEQETDKGEEMV